MVTFAVAAYNVENYISSCVDSILSQSEEDFEVLIIDDGSRDGTGALCDSYALRDSRVRVIHQQNSGVSSVRNLAIKEAKGDWICFVDGDDLIAAGAYDTLVKNVTDEFDIVYFDMQYFIYDNTLPPYTAACEPMEIKDADGIKLLRLTTLYEAKGSMNYKNKCLRSVCAKAFNLRFLRSNGLCLEKNLKYGEDVVFKLDCLKYAKAVKFVRRPFYLYRRREDSAIHKYNPSAVSQFSDLVVKLKQRVEDDDMNERCRLEAFSDMRLVFVLDMFHPNNPKTCEQRERDYNDFISLDWCRECLESVDPSVMKERDRRGYEIINSGGFNGLCKFYEKENRIQKIKTILNKIGLNRLLKPIRDKVKGLMKK